MPDNSHMQLKPLSGFHKNVLTLSCEVSECKPLSQGRHRWHGLRVGPA